MSPSEEQYRTLAQNFPNGAVALFDRDLRYTLMEGEVLEAIGLSKEHYDGKTIWEALPPETARAVEPVFRAALAGESSVSEVTSRGRVYYVQIVPVRGEGGEITAGKLVALDVTERKRAEEDIRQTPARTTEAPAGNVKAFGHGSRTIGVGSRALRCPGMAERPVRPQLDVAYRRYRSSP